jgi:hypothetical protein
MTGTRSGRDDMADGSIKISDGSEALLLKIHPPFSRRLPNPMRHSGFHRDDDNVEA